MNKRHYEHTLPNIRGSLSNTYSGFHDPVIKEQEQEPQVAADRYGQQNISHAYCFTHARSLFEG